jgi:1-acyl-sn-glycerol-3-phosphate acyltransferase
MTGGGDPAPRPGAWMVFAIGVVRPLSRMFTRRQWHGLEHIPRSGGVIVAANHVSWVDPFALGHFVYAAGRIPRFMAKESLFHAFAIGRILRGARQIRVHRGERDGADALRDAVEALRNGEAVLIYPEGTITGDPNCWPMKAKTGVARLSMMSGAPIVPVSQWGPQEILGASRRLHLFPRHTVRIVATKPIYPDFLGWGDQPSRAALRVLTAEVMDRIRTELAVIREEPAPAGVWDPAVSERILPSAQEGAA